MYNTGDRHHRPAHARVIVAIALFTSVASASDRVSTTSVWIVVALGQPAALELFDVLTRSEATRAALIGSAVLT